MQRQRPERCSHPPALGNMNFCSFSKHLLNFTLNDYTLVYFISGFDAALSYKISGRNFESGYNLNL